MATINSVVRKPRVKKVVKSKRSCIRGLPAENVVCALVYTQLHLKNRTQHYVKYVVFV